MKTILLSILFLLSAWVSVVKSQEKQLFGFDMLNWGSSREEVKSYMKDNHDMSAGYEKEDAVGYQGGNFLGHDIFLWVYFFNEEGLEETDLVIKNVDRPLGAIFSEIVHRLSADYGDPDLFKPDDWDAEWFYYDLSGKQLNGTIKVSHWTNDKMSSVKISFLKIKGAE